MAAADDLTAVLDVAATDPHGRGPLWFACQSGNRELVSRLLSQRASPEQADLLGWRPLHLASYHGSLDVVELLIARRCELDARTNAGQTARWLAHSHALARDIHVSTTTHKEIADALAAVGGSLGLEVDGQSRADRGEVRLCAEDGKQYTLEDLIRTYADEQHMFTREECAEYFYREMRCLASDHAAWQLEIAPAPPAQGAQIPVVLCGDVCLGLQVTQAAQNLSDHSREVGRPHTQDPRTPFCR